MVGQLHSVDLDAERQASMADEGGVSGAVMESQEPALGRRDAAHRAETLRESRWRAAFLVGAAVGAALGIWAYRTRD
jgi:hypothetical protein